MPIDLFSWRAMTETINKINRAPALFQELLFKVRNPRASETIDFDKISGSRKLLPFVSRVGAGTIIEQVKREVGTIEAPRIRPKKPFPAADLLSSRAPGQSIYVVGSESIAQAMEKKLALELLDLRTRIDLTLEYWCGQALTGLVTVSQDDLAFTVDYRMPAAHKIVLATGSKWGEAGGDPDYDLQAWADLIVNKCGYAPDIAIMGTAACSAFTSDAKVQKLLDIRRVEAGTLAPSVKTNYVGTYKGIDVYRYGGTYEGADGNAYPMIGADKVSFGSSLAPVSIEFGLILDLDAGAQVQGEIFSKSWKESDPSVQWLLAESRPLPVLWDAEAFVFADVL